MKTLSIDQSLNETGYWINDDINGLIKPRKDLEQFEKITYTQARIKDLIKNNEIKTVIMEGYSYGSRNTRFTFTAGELGGCIKLVCHELGVKIIIIPPTLIKKFICGKGNAKKELMLLKIYKKYGREFKNNNLADAYAIHSFYHHYLRWGDKVYVTQEFAEKMENVPKYEVECFERFEKTCLQG